ncbi:8-demethyl-8-(2,3-dimethoxy-alpha-L-rhamnosyl)-tetracenomycin-C 4'-O-methyltransferase [Picochlorum sp. SENEW3]|nr:8-demethyl-8-(2,3-dimethoxy-alpha-L-rhamnosyl)-tetracenomycin-C 4'-O-methyltransferase [Picochlorum sp. SENEW3]WPT15798.1 8-demethyl-8-(2,3-dimethoxy-alpha-L-rhamnosyl)-tetracenomycin-C 4'-O-methyltransferase [Picochlorum sp. SENEW3]
MVAQDKLKQIYDEVRSLNAQEISGDIVECGVWAGGASLAMIYGQLSNQRLPPPDSTKDGQREKAIWSQIANGTYNVSSFKKTVLNRWNYAPLAFVKSIIGISGYPPSQLHFIKGKVEETIPRFIHALPTKIALLRLDTDWYDSTMVEMNFLYDRLVPGGLLIVDDYCAWSGSRNAINDYFGSTQEVEKIAIHKGPLCLTLRKPQG